LQSTNEELNTVNDELHSRNDELARVNSDLMNLLGSVDLPIVIVGDDMRIRRFTPAAEPLFNLISGDVGRPIGQVNSNIVCDNLEALIRAAMEGVNLQEQEVRNREGYWYSLRVRPYKGVDNRLDGAVVTAIDINASRQYQTQVERSRNYFTAIFELVGQPLVVLDGSLRVRAANVAFCQVFHTTRQEIEGASFFDLANGQWNTSELRNVLAVASTDEAAHDVRITRDPAADGAQPLMIRVRGLQLDDKSQWIVMAMELTDA
jgi:two-component system CheB/CheR fusion protein